jgi:hypothetical protein
MLADESWNRKMDRNTQLVVGCGCLDFRLKVVYLIELSCQHVAVTNIRTSCSVALIVVKTFRMVTLPDFSIFCVVALSDVGSLLMIWQEIAFSTGTESNKQFRMSQ